MAQHDYGFTLYVRKFDERVWLPIACNTRAEVDAQVAHCLAPGGPYDVARVVERVGTSNVFRDRGERYDRAVLADPPLTG